MSDRHDASTGDPAAPRITARRVRSDNRFFVHAEEDLVLPDGAGGYTYQLIEARHDAVVVLPVCEDGRLVVERIYRHPYRQWFYEFPAGGIEPGEDPCAAAARELREETGYAGGTPRLVQRFHTMPGLLHMDIHLVRIDGCQLLGGEAREALELMDIELLTPAQCWALARGATPSSFLLYGLWALGMESATAG
jgi:ADP-ribose pyrophosphatase